MKPCLQKQTQTRVCIRAGTAVPEQSENVAKRSVRRGSMVQVHSSLPRKDASPFFSGWDERTFKANKVDSSAFIPTIKKVRNIGLFSLYIKLVLFCIYADWNYIVLFLICFDWIVFYACQNIFFVKKKCCAF